MQTSKLLVALSLIFLSCNYRQVKKQHVGVAPTNTIQRKETETLKVASNEKIAIPGDTTSSDYLIYLLKNEMPLTAYWSQQLKKLNAFAIPLDSTSRLSIKREYAVNDSVSVIILQYSTNVGSDEFLITVKNKKFFVARVHISNQYDSDVSEENPDYYYTEYQQIDDRKIKLRQHKMKNYDTDKEKDIVTIEHWTIEDNGEVVKK